ncbi:adenine deaminase [Eupransor demetentiae]|uniref:Adenine deaminase n=1 Tax=Eupransor demetentiae TaxID=3109584 RepID=A0ABM9N3L6_9LACO|nr:Adenine deaminase (AdeC) [Lactobacillaceae bacterium LMG 33000]
MQAIHFRNGQILNVFTQEFEKKDFYVKNGKISYVGPQKEFEAEQSIDLQGKTVVPGFIDAHLHIESSLLTPSEFGRLSLTKGVTSVFADPHEIASVDGKKGINYMLEAAKLTPLNIYYMLPSSVPATPFEHAGAVLKAPDLKEYYKNDQVMGLAEVMDFPAVAKGDADLIQKIKDVQTAGKHADGHGAGLSREDLAIYRQYGIDTDHEATTKQEALDRISMGMTVFVREGTVERDEVNLLPAITASNSSHFAFATDDKTADDIEREGSIDYNIKLAIQNGMQPAMAYTLASYNGAQAHGLKNVGAIAEGYAADLVILDEPESVKINQVMVAGEFIEGQSYRSLPFDDGQMNFTFEQKDLDLPLDADKPAHIIEVMPHHITTEHRIEKVPVVEGRFQPNDNYAKIAVIERYRDLGHGLGIIKGLNIQKGAIASSVAHDSHNIVVAGQNDHDMYLAVETIRKLGGGQVFVKDGQVSALPLAVAGLMAEAPYEEVIEQHQHLLKAFKQVSKIDFDPFLTLSFMALPVIPSLKITDQGLFDFDQFKFITIQD